MLSGLELYHDHTRTYFLDQVIRVIETKDDEYSTRNKMSEDPLLDRMTEEQEGGVNVGDAVTTKSPPKLNSKEMLDDKYGVLDKYYDGWLKDCGFLLEFWRMNSLLKHQTSAAERRPWGVTMRRPAPSKTQQAQPGRKEIRSRG